MVNRCIRGVSLLSGRLRFDERTGQFIRYRTGGTVNKTLQCKGSLTVAMTRYFSSIIRLMTLTTCALASKLSK